MNPRNPKEQAKTTATREVCDINSNRPIRIKAVNKLLYVILSILVEDCEDNGIGVGAGLKTNGRFSVVITDSLFGVEVIDGEMTRLRGAGSLKLKELNIGSSSKGSSVTSLVGRIRLNSSFLLALLNEFSSKVKAGGVDIRPGKGFSGQGMMDLAP